MWIVVQKKDNAPLSDWYRRLEPVIAASRFRANLSVETFSRLQEGIKISTVRLRRSKPYCGAHPGPCLATFARRHRKSPVLEGADWVGFNQLVNDVLDKARACCDVFSYNNEAKVSRYYIRHGTRRRIGFPHDFNGRFAFWVAGNQLVDFADHCGRKPPTLVSLDFDRGTPGLASYCPKAEVKFLAQLEYH